MLQRLLSAVTLLPLVLVLVWWSYWTVVLAIVAVTIVGLMELYGAFAQGGYRSRLWTGVGASLLLILAVTLREGALLPFDPLPLTFSTIVIASLIGLLLNHEHAQRLLPSWGLTLGGVLYIAWLFSHFIMLRALDMPLNPSFFASFGVQAGAAWIYFVLTVTWMQDTAAYFAGRTFGRHKMAPVLSPKKTWEGAAGGLVGAVLGGVLCVVLFGLPITLLQGVLLGIIGGVAGPLGDLAESLIKRQVGIKDAGSLIPGHGGLLDRADSLLFTAPILFYLILILTAS